MTDRGVRGRRLARQLAKAAKPDRSATDLAAIKAREAQLRLAIERGVMVDCGPFTMAQLGLFPIYGDRKGRLWRNEGGVLTLVGGSYER